MASGYWITLDACAKAGIILPGKGFVSLDTAQAEAIAIFNSIQVPLLIYSVPDMSTVDVHRLIAYPDWVPVDGVNAVSIVVGTYQQRGVASLGTTYPGEPYTAGPGLADRELRLVATSVPGEIKVGAITGTNYRSADITINVLYDPDVDDDPADMPDNEASPVWQFRALSPADDPDTAPWSDPSLSPFTFPGLFPNCPYRLECIDTDNEQNIAYIYAPVEAPPPGLGIINFQADETSTIQWTKPLDAVWSDDGGSLDAISLGFLGRDVGGHSLGLTHVGALAPHTAGDTTLIEAYDNEDPVTGQVYITYCAQAYAEYGGSWGDGWYDGEVPVNQNVGAIPNPAPFPPEYALGFPYSAITNEQQFPPQNLAEVCGYVPGVNPQFGGGVRKGPPLSAPSDTCSASPQKTVNTTTEGSTNLTIQLGPRNSLDLNLSGDRTGVKASAGIQVNDSGTGLGSVLNFFTGTPCVEIGFQVDLSAKFGKGKGLGRPKLRLKPSIGPYLELGSGGTKPNRIDL